MGLLADVKEEIDTIFARDPAARSVLEVVFCYPGFHAIMIYKVSHCFWEKGFFFLGRLTSHFGRFLTGIEIHPNVKIGKRFFIDHGMGVVIGETAEIGDDVTIYHGVTLGGVSLNKGKRHPTIGNNVVIGSGAKILGPFTVGENSRVGSNSVVVKEVSPNSTVVGVPGRSVAEAKNKDDFQHNKLPDPVANAVSCVVDRIVELEKEIIDLRERLGSYENNNKK